MSYPVMSLKALRINKGLTAKQVAGIIGKTEKTVQNWESGYTGIPAKEITKLAKLYNYPVDSIKEAQ